MNNNVSSLVERTMSLYEMEARKRTCRKRSWSWLSLKHSNNTRQKIQLWKMENQSMPVCVRNILFLSVRITSLFIVASIMRSDHLFYFFHNQKALPRHSGLWKCLIFISITGVCVAAFYLLHHWSVLSPTWVHHTAARRTHWTFDVKSK